MSEEPNLDNLGVIARNLVTTVTILCRSFAKILVRGGFRWNMGLLLQYTNSTSLSKVGR
jgi:hypothetical protein